MTNEKKEFEALFRDMYPKLYYTAIQIVKDEETCRDIVGDFFEHLWIHRAEVEPTKHPAFLYRMIQNKCIDYLRRQTTRNKYIEFYNLLYGTTAEDVEQSWKDNEQRIEAMHHVIKTMTPQTQNILKMCYFKGMKYREVAEELNISVSAVRKHLAQAFRQLRSSLAINDNDS